VARASYYVPDFLGGEWSPRAQGQISDPRYKTAMNLCLNGYPVEEGAWIRRANWRMVGASYRGYPGKIFPLTYRDGALAELELTCNGTNSWMRIWGPPTVNTLGGPAYLGEGPYSLYCDAFDTVTAFATSPPAQITTGSAHTGWANGDMVILFRANGASVAARQFIITKIDSTHFTLVDSITGFGIDGTSPEFNSVAYVGHVAVFAMPMTTLLQVKTTTITSTDGLTFIFNRNFSTNMLTTVFDGNGNPTFTLGDATFNQYDGPYIDPFPGLSQTSNSIGSVVLDADTVHWDFTITDGAYTFVSSDVGRAIRMWNQPPAYNGSTAYTQGQNVSYQNAFWSMGKSGVPAGTAPMQSYTSGGVAYTPWVLAPTAGYWTYGTIYAVTGASTATCTMAQVPNINQNTVDTWLIGAYTTGQYPACGTWYDGRLYLGGSIPRRFDTTVSGINPARFATAPSLASLPGTLGVVFSATDVNGNVLDNRNRTRSSGWPRTSRVSLPVAAAANG
jgi:hypothetical protein